MKQNRLNLSEIHSLELDILKYIDMKCKEYNLNYSLAYGTLLGAIRHKGFIPWDDDIDIFMLREDYNKFIEALSKDNNGRYSLLSVTNDKNYCYDYAKVVDTYTKIEMNDIVVHEKDGLWVDVFPLDEISRHPRAHKLFIASLVLLNSFSLHLHFPKEKRGLLWFPVWGISRLIGPRFFARAIDKCVQLGNDERYIGRIGGATIRKDYYFKKDWCLTTINVSFEGSFFQAYEKYDDLLKREYGNYMLLPPKDKRICHPVVAYMR